MCLGQFDPRVSLRRVRSPFREHTSLLPLVPWISMRLPTEIGVGMSCMGSQTSTLRTCAAVGMSVVWINEMSEFLNFGGLRHVCTFGPRCVSRGNDKSSNWRLQSLPRGPRLQIDLSWSTRVFWCQKEEESRYLAIRQI